MVSVLVSAAMSTAGLSALSFVGPVPPVAAATQSGYETAVRSDQPVSWWPFDETAGALARDAAGPNPGMIQGSVKLGVPGPFEGSTAFQFDGAPCSGVDVGRQPDTLALQRLTIEAWSRTSTADRGIVFRWRHHGYGLHLFDGSLSLDGYPGGTPSAARGSTGLADGRWHHLVGEWTGSEWRVFVDGVLAGMQAATGELLYDGSHAVAIGRDADACDGWVRSFQGDLAHVAVYGTALSPARVLAHYCAGVPGAAPCQPNLTADAGVDQSVVEGSTVRLDGSGSSRGVSESGEGGTASTGLGGRLYATGAPVEVEVLAATAGITSALWLLEPHPERDITTNRDIGTVHPLGRFTPGVELVFGIRYGGVELRMGPASRNPDGLEHAVVHAVRPGVFRVGFEDLVGGGDLDYDDNMFEFRGGIATDLPLTYAWETVSSGGPPVRLSSTADPRPSFTALDDGTYTFRLTLSDGVTSDTDEVRVRVTNVDPVVHRIEADPAATDGLAQATVVLGDQGILDAHWITFDWGDGSTDKVPAVLDGTGWGYGFSGHVYATTGDKTVSAVVTDKDGGSSMPKKLTFNVGAAGPGEPTPGAALWAAGQESNAIRISGSANEVVGLVHSNGGIGISGSGHLLLGGVEHHGTVDVRGSGSVIQPAPMAVPVADLPAVFVMADYLPGGRAAVATGARYHDIPATACRGGGWTPVRPLVSGLYHVPCNVRLSGSDIGGQVTIASAGDIALSGSRARLSPFVDGLLFVSASTGAHAVDLAGSGHVLQGSIFAAQGGVEITGSGNELDCGVVGRTVRIVGSRNTVSGVSCGSAPGGGTVVPIAAPPAFVPHLQTSFAADRDSALPGEVVTYTSTLANGIPGPGGGGTAVMPVELAVDNRGGSAITVRSAVYELEYHDLVLGQWVTLASTDPVAPADQRAAVSLVMRPNPADRVTYAADGSLAGTRVESRAFASWAAAAVLRLSTDQVKLLMDPARVDGLRNAVEIVSDGYAVRRIARFDDDPLGALRTAPRADVSDVRITTTSPAGSVVVGAAQVPALAALPPGGTATTATTATTAAAGVPAPKGSSETDDAYVARLLDLDGRDMIGTSFGWALAGIGAVYTSQQVHRTTQRVPVVRATITAPTRIDTPGAATWTVHLHNDGSAPAVGLDVDVDLPGVGQLPITGLPARLEPGASATVVARREVPAGTSTSFTATAAVTWSDASGRAGDYGPVGGSATLVARPPLALGVTKFWSVGTETPAGHVQYSIDVRNNGNNPLTDVELVDPIDSNVDLVASSVQATNATITRSDTRLDATIGTLAPGAFAHLTFLVDTTGAPASVDRTTNQATVTSAELDPVLSDDPLADGSADVTVAPASPAGGTGTGGAATGPDVSAMAPADGSVVTEAVDVTADVTPRPGTNVASWRLTARSAADPSVSQVLGQGVGAPGPVLGTFDPTVVANGIWVLRLTVAGSDSAATVSEAAVVVEGALKFGRFAVTYEDMAVPVGDLPVQVLRTYDSLRRSARGDFGHGWSLELSTFRVEVNRPLGDGGWEQYSCGSGLVFASLCYRSTRPHFVSVTWPDGRVETFDFTPRGLSTFFSPGGSPAFTARNGSTSELLPAPDDPGLSSSDGNLLTGAFGDGGIYDPRRFLLRAADGTEYLLDRTSGLIEAKNRNGSMLTITADGIRSSDGAGITFVRGVGGLIDAVEGPDGVRVEYTRDATGDLVRVRDVRGNTTSFSYDDHLMREADDPGPGVFRRLDYDDDDRLIAITDASGTRTVVETDPDARVESVTSADGRLTTRTTFDDRGNAVVVQQIHDGRTRTTKFEYDQRDQLVARVDQAGNRSSATYDDDLNLTSLREADGDTLRMTYDEYGALTAWTDGEGRTVTYNYDDTGDLVSMTAPGEAATTYDHDDRGRIVSRTDPGGGVSTWAYDTAGNVVRETTPAGTTSWTFDDAGHVLSETDADGTTSWTYDASGNPLTEVDPEGETAWTYDADGRVTRVEDATGVATLAYDALGNMVAHTDAAGDSTTWTYDRAGRIRTETGGGETTTWDYDGAGRELRETDSTGTTEWTWADNDRAVRAIKEGLITEVDWHPDGRIAAVRDPVRGVSTFEWDAAGRLAEMVEPDGTVRTSTWDVFGSSTPSLAPVAETSRLSATSAGGTAVLDAPPSFVDTLTRPRPIPRVAPPPRPALPGMPAYGRPPRPPTTPLKRSEGSGGLVLGEYLTMVQWAIDNMAQIAAAGVATAVRLEEAARSLTESLSTDHGAPLAREPEKRPHPKRTPLIRPADPAPLPRVDPADEERCDTSYEGPPPEYERAKSDPNYEARLATHGWVLVTPWRALYGNEQGTDASRHIKPPGFIDGDYGHTRGHLIGKLFGGDGQRIDNLVTMFEWTNNDVMRPDYEEWLQEYVKYTCHATDYHVWAEYREGRPLPVFEVRLLAVGPQLLFDDVIPNVPGPNAV
ncbi:MAG TPA: LamG-like jellyroll fold domain-containing protein [Mycobacteriales bacterium]